MGKTATGQTMRSAERLLQVLSVFTLDHPARSISELSSELDLAPSTVRRLVSTLERFGYLRQEQGRYVPHYQLLRLAAVAQASSDLVTAGSPILDRLAEETGEAVELAVRAEASVVVVSSRVSKQMFRLFRPTGSVYPAYRGSAAGKVLLAWLDERDLERVVPSGGSWPAKIPGSITTTRQLRAALRIVREQGYAINEGETDQDVWVVAAPVRDDREVVAAVSIPCLASRVPATKKKQFVNIVCDGAAELSRALVSLR